MCHVEHHTQTALDTRHVVGGEFSHLIAHTVVVHVHLTDEVRQLARIDLHRTRCRAQSVGGTGLVTIVFILFLQTGGALGSGCSCRGAAGRTGGGLQLADFALHGDTHS